MGALFLLPDEVGNTDRFLKIVSRLIEEILSITGSQLQQIHGGICRERQKMHERSGNRIDLHPLPCSGSETCFFENLHHFRKGFIIQRRVVYTVYVTHSHC